MQNVSSSIYDSIFSIVWNDSITLKHLALSNVHSGEFSSVSDTAIIDLHFIGKVEYNVGGGQMI
jgi:hypothetical protein